MLFLGDCEKVVVVIVLTGCLEVILFERRLCDDIISIKYLFPDESYLKFLTRLGT